MVERPRAPDQRPTASAPGRRLAEQDPELGPLPGGKLDARLQRGARVEAGAVGGPTAGARGPGPRAGRGCRCDRGTRSDPPSTPDCRPPRSRKATVAAEVRVRRVAGEERPGRSASGCSIDPGRGRATRDAQRPFGVRGHRQPAATAGPVLDRERRRPSTGRPAARTAPDRARSRRGRARSGCSRGRAARHRSDPGERIGERGRAPRARRSRRRGRRWPRRPDRRRGRSTTASAGSPGCCPTRCTRHRTPRRRSRTPGLATTFTHGAGVDWPGPSTVTYSRPSCAKPPRPLKNSSSGRGTGSWLPGDSSVRQWRQPRHESVPAVRAG